MIATPAYPHFIKCPWLRTYGWVRNSSNVAFQDEVFTCSVVPITDHKRRRVESHTEVCRQTGETLCQLSWDTKDRLDRRRHCDFAGSLHEHRSQSSPTALQSSPVRTSYCSWMIDTYAGRPVRSWIIPPSHSYRLSLQRMSGVV